MQMCRSKMEHKEKIIVIAKLSTILYNMISNKSDTVQLNLTLFLLLLY